MRYQGKRYKLFGTEDRNTRDTMNGFRCRVKSYNNPQSTNGCVTCFRTSWEPREDPRLVFLLTYLPNLLRLRSSTSSNLRPGSTPVLQAFSAVNSTKVGQSNVPARFQTLKVTGFALQCRGLDNATDLSPGPRHHLNFHHGKFLKKLWRENNPPILDGTNTKTSRI